MGIIDDLKRIKEQIDNLPPIPKCIEVTHYLYTKIKEESYINERIYGKPKSSPFGFGEIPLWIASEDEQNNWTEEEKRKQFKVSYE